MQYTISKKIEIFYIILFFFNIAMNYRLGSLGILVL